MQGKGVITITTLNRNYKIAGFVMNTNIPAHNLRNNFNEYLCFDKSKPDVYAILSSETDKSLYTPKISVNEYKYYTFQDSTHYYIYKKNRYVLRSEIKNNNITICIVPDLENNEEVNTEITYALMDSFYTFLHIRKTFCLHSCGIIINGKGVLVAGQSGSGKSRLVHELAKCYKIQYVGEDINACRIENKEIVFYGMPWCRINFNVSSKVDKLIYLCNTNDIYEELYESEFCMRWLSCCNNLVDIFSKAFHDKFIIFENKKDIYSINKFIKVVLGG